MVITLLAALLALQQLDSAVTQTKGQSTKDSTRKNILSQLTAYQKFCDRYVLHYFPCDNRQLCRFGQYLSETFQSPDSVGNYLSGISTWLALLGLQVPDTSDKQMKMFAAGLKRVMSHSIKQAEPVTQQLLLRMSKVVKFIDQVEMVAWTALLLGFYLFLRKSNLIPDTMTTYNIDQQFLRGDINLLGLDRAMMIEIRWSKTIQYRQKVLRLPVLPANNKAICPVYWFHHMINRVQGEPDDLAFTLMQGTIKLVLSANQLIYRFHKLMKEDDSKFSLHSLCRGRATFAYQANMGGEMIKLLGDWASDTYKRYIDVSMDKRYDSMKTFVEALNRLCEAFYM